MAFQAASARRTDRVGSRAYQFTGVSRSLIGAKHSEVEKMRVTNTTLTDIILTLAVLLMATAFAMAPDLTNADLSAEHISYMLCVTVRLAFD